MYIRQTKTNSAASGESYVTYRLVRSERDPANVRQITVLPLGRHFSFNQEDWPLLCQRIEQILCKQNALQTCQDDMEIAAQRYAAAIFARESTPGKEAIDGTGQQNFAQVDVDSIQLTLPR